MGRSFESVRMGVKDVSARWLMARRALKKDVPDLRSEAGRNGQEALQRVVKCIERLAGSSGIFRVGGGVEEYGQERNIGQGIYLLSRKIGLGTVSDERLRYKYVRVHIRS